jgi:hypothetical protein
MADLPQLPEGWTRFKSSEQEVRPLFLRSEHGLVVELYATKGDILLRAQNAPLEVIRWALAFAATLETA